MIKKVICYVIGGIFIVWAGYIIGRGILLDQIFIAHYLYLLLGICIVIIGKLISKKKVQQNGNTEKS